MTIDLLETNRRNTLRPSQRAPSGNWTFWLLLAGRGFGKGYAGANWVIDAVESGAARHIALVAATAADVRSTLVEGPSGILTLAAVFIVGVRPHNHTQLDGETVASNVVRHILASSEHSRGAAYFDGYHTFSGADRQTSTA
jgi:phage terminase large subunit-like protein